MRPVTRRVFLERTGIGALTLAGAPLVRAVSARAPFYKSLGVCTSVRKATAVKAFGAEYVEEGVRRFLVPGEPDEVFEQKLAEAAGAPLLVPCCNSFLPGSIRTTGPDLDLQKVLAYADTAFRRARRAGVEVIVFGSSGSRRLADNFPREKAVAQFVGVLKGMGPLAEARGVTVAVEPLRYQECNFINTVLQGADIVGKADHPHVRLVADLYHMLCNGESPEDLAHVVKLVKHVHIAEKEGRTAPGVHGDRFGPFFRVLREGGYRGRISIEGRWTDDTLARGFEVIREQAAEA